MGKIRIATYRLRIMGPDATEYPDIDLAERGIEIDITELDLGKVEETVNSMLPDGWYCKIED